MDLQVELCRQLPPLAHHERLSAYCLLGAKVGINDSTKLYIRVYIQLSSSLQRLRNYMYIHRLVVIRSGTDSTHPGRLGPLLALHLNEPRARARKRKNLLLPCEY